MRRLLWKEFRERRVWASLWAVSILATSLFGHTQTFFGEKDLILSTWTACPLVFALLVGAGTYASETKAGRAFFTLSRPIHAGSLMAVKLLFAGIIIFGVPLLAGLIFRLIAPPPYHAFITLPHILAGVWALGWKIGVVYLFGMACSAVLPGLAGTMLTISGVCILAVAVMMVTPWFGAVDGLMANLFVVTGMLLAAVWAGMRVAYSGLSVSADERVKRFVFVFVPMIFLTVLIQVFALAVWWKSMLRWEPVAVNSSPNAKYAFVRYEQNLRLLGVRLFRPDGALAAKDVLMRGNDQAIINLPAYPEGFVKHPTYSPYRPSEWHWLSDNLAIKNRNTLGKILFLTLEPRIEYFTVDGGQDKFYSFEYYGSNWYTPLSPDGDIMMIHATGKKNLKGRESKFRFIDLKKRVLLKEELQHSDGVWWESNDSIGYYSRDSRGRQERDGKGKRVRHILRLTRD